jgi:Zn-dependent protease with chaperone function
MNPATIERYEKRSKRNPTLYRAQVACAAIVGDAAHMGLVLLPIAIGIALPMIFYQHPLFYWVGGISFVLLAWLMRPGIRITGRPLAVHEGVRLREDIETIKQTLNVPGRIDIVLDDEFNAAAHESRGFFGLFGTKRVLILGIPLLNALSHQECVAVLAHELGHFSRRHGRLGHWIYRARLGWMHAQDVDENDTILDRAMASYASWFVPWFSAMSFIYSRQCEYEADADAVSATHRDHLASALTRLSVLAQFRRSVLPRVEAIWSEASAVPPRDYYARLADAARDWLATQRDEAIKSALQEPSSVEDTHPALAARVAAISAQAKLDESAAENNSGGAVWFGAAWSALREEYSEQWVRQNKQRWAAQFHFYHAIEQPLLTTPIEATTKWPIQAQLRYALVHDARHESQLLAKLLSAHPDSKAVCFEYWKAQLEGEEAKHADAIRELTALWKSTPTYRLAIATLFCDHYSDQTNSTQKKEWQAKRTAHAESRRAAMNRALDRLERGDRNVETADSPPLHEDFAREHSESLQRFIRAQVADDQLVTSAWMFTIAEQLLNSESANRREYDDADNALNVIVLCLRLNTAALETMKLDEDDIAQSYRDGFMVALNPTERCAVLTHLSTESIPAYLDQHQVIFSR